MKKQLFPASMSVPEEKLNRSFTLIELLVKRLHLCCNRVYGKEQRCSPACRQVKLYSFTLIELLVVIAIIAILAAILLPALQSARARGLMSACSSNMKNMSVSVNLYADNYDGYLVPAAALKHDRWFLLLNAISGRKGNKKYELSDIFRDPAVPPDVWSPVHRNDKNYKASYITNYGMSAYTGAEAYSSVGRYTTFYKVGVIKHASKRPLIADYYNITSGANGNSANIFGKNLCNSVSADTLTNRHRRNINILNVGGNVEAVRLPQADQFPENRFWFAKGSW